MIITPQALRGIYTAFNTVFNKAFEGQHPTYEKVATVVPSTSESETYAWLGDIPGMRSGSVSARSRTSPAPTTPSRTRTSS